MAAEKPVAKTRGDPPWEILATKKITCEKWRGIVIKIARSTHLKREKGRSAAPHY